MIAAFISADGQARKAKINAFLESTKPKLVIYVCPQSIMWQAAAIERPVYAAPFEKMEAREQWLTMHAMAGPDTALIMECVARYPKITSTKFAHLQRLSQQVGHKFWTDVVPFTLGIEYIYTPLSYLDRSVLGFPHWYAFREAFDEIDHDGKQVSSHDPGLIARKVSRVIEWGRRSIVADHRVVMAKSSEVESAKYQDTKVKVFANFASPTKAITVLADVAHAFKSRRELTAEVANSMDRPLVLTNLASYATKLQPMLTTGQARSLALGAAEQDIGRFSDVVYAESPIVKSYLAFDIEAQLPPDAKAILIASEMKVDALLRDRFLTERGEINAVTAAAMEMRDAA
jgi:hypothetical protein